ncbi:SlyX family protein [Stenoxybacter acetivorans]|uniref:SlyX family protein n=1 Tax=Stenoxybacter acetivorans TaxID=422441 RepID=UPI0005681A5E|nr:SlyX family protein [Stenoxybacter acetivorans]
MSNQHEHRRLEELEIRVAWQEDLLESLSDTVARLQETLSLQQAQLRLLYQRLPEKNEWANPARAEDEIPPHY